MSHDPGGKISLSLPDDVISTAILSKCDRYRYELHRRWKLDEPTKSIMFIMMNPSTATHDVDDPTVRKCRFLADRWGYNHMIITNVMAYRATHPKDLLSIDDPQGPANLSTICRLLNGDAYSYVQGNFFSTGRIPMPFDPPTLVCAWGRIPKKLAWAERNVILLIENYKPHVLRLNKDGGPWHPLYLPNDIIPIPWSRFEISQQ